MRTDRYTVTVNRRGLLVCHEGEPENGITLGEYDALIVALIRMRDQYLLERMAVEDTDTSDTEQPEWGEQYDT